MLVEEFEPKNLRLPEGTLFTTRRRKSWDQTKAKKIGSSAPPEREVSKGERHVANGISSVFGNYRTAGAARWRIPGTAETVAF
jgi:hypothetical protein